MCPDLARVLSGLSIMTVVITGSAWRRSDPLHGNCSCERRFSLNWHPNSVTPGTVRYWGVPHTPHPVAAVRSSEMQ